MLLNVAPRQSPRSLPAFLLVLTSITAAWAQIPGVNVNMVTGTEWPGGDPFLQRQNEPSMAISSRNSLHMLAGANDYRTVDLPGTDGLGEPNGDAWLGLFKSFDGGQTWTSTLIPGYPQDTSPQGVASPLKGLAAAADPGVRAGANGMFYYSGIAFNRADDGNNKLFVARFVDNNNIEGSDSINYINTSLITTSDAHHFEDKPALAVDIPRSGAGSCTITTAAGTQRFPAGNVYVAWTEFKANGNQSSAILFSYSKDCGATFSAPQQISDSATKINQGTAVAVDPNTGTVYVTWRVFADKAPARSDAIAYVAIPYSGLTKVAPLAPVTIAAIQPFDQGDTFESFRTNSYPAIAVDGASRVYVTWAQRGSATPCTASCGDARVVVATGVPAPMAKNGASLNWSSPSPVDPWSGRGHQFMPAIAFSAGKLTVAWYDLRNDDLIGIYTPLGGGQYSSALSNDGGAPDFPSFGFYVQDPAPPYAADARRQTLDIRAAQALPGNPPSFQPSVQVSQYEAGSTADNPSVIQQLQVNAPNLPMFQHGTLPFMGDYIDIAGPDFLPNPDGTWRYNNLQSDVDYTHVVWADNRNVVQPADGNWANYTPPTYGTSLTSIYDPTQQRPACTVTTSGDTRDRNQDIYTAALSSGLVVSARGNAKTLGDGGNGQPIDRAFPITIQNGTAQSRWYQLSLGSQPAGGTASFLQFPVDGLPFPLTQIYLQAPPLSSSSRSVFVVSTNPNATVPVSVVEATGFNGPPIAGGQTGSITINSDITNPNISNPNISNVEIYNPNISNPNISNPNISNPNISTPNISNPNISNPNISNVTVANPNISNPNISNPNISNPNISNPNISNPNISNPNISNAALTDATWSVTNNGNTAASYSLKLLGGKNVPTGVGVQLIVSQSYSTPSVIGCNQAVEQHFVPVANITNVVFSDGGDLLQPAATDPTAPSVALLPGETAFVTLRVLDTTTSDPGQALQHFNPGTLAAPVIVAHGANTGSTTPPIALVIVPQTLKAATATGPYSAQLVAIGGTGTYSWTASGSLPSGIQLSPAGLLAGTTTATGTFAFTASVSSGAQTLSTNFTLIVNPAPSLVTATTAAGDAGMAFTQPVSASGGTAPLSAFRISAGTLPSPLTLNGSGIAGALPTPGTYNFTVSVSDANGVNAAQPVVLIVNPAPTITTVSLLGAVQGGSYTQTIGATGGAGSLSFTPVTVDGVSLNGAGQFSGTPALAGSFPFTATVTDSLHVSSSVQLTLAVTSSLAIVTSSLPNGTVGVAWPTTQLTATGGIPGYSNWAWMAANGSSLVPGLSLDPASGNISGAPTAAGTYSFVVSVMDSQGFTASTPLSITVAGAALSISGATIPVTVGTPVNYTIPVTGGTAPLNWSFADSPPAGMHFANGVFSGTPQAGSFAAPYDAPSWSATGGSTPQISASAGVTPNCPVTISVSDSASQNASALFQIQPTPSSPCATFSYAANGDTFGGTGPGISGSWTFQNTASTTGTLTFHYHYTGFHAFFEVTAKLQAFSGGNTVTLYSAGPADCCTTPSAGFDVQGAGSIAVTAGAPFGFVLSGGNGDSNSTMNGTLVITDFSIQ